jgi:hypothetical protein
MLIVVILMLLFDPAIASASCNYSVIQKGETCLNCYDFSLWSEVNEINSLINCSNKAFYIYVKPIEPIVLTSDLDLCMLACFQSIPLNLFLLGVSGLNVYPWPSSQSFGCNLQVYLTIFMSTIDFYVNSTYISSYNCQRDLIPDDSSTNVSFFSSYTTSLALQYGNKYGSSSTAVCPYVFKNAQFGKGISARYQVDSFLFVNLLEFQQVNDTISINSNIQSLFLEGYNYADVNLDITFQALTRYREL